LNTIVKIYSNRRLYESLKQAGIYRSASWRRCTAETGKTVNVRDNGKFQDGRVFDSSISRSQPITFLLGKGRVIKGWDEGIALMKVGSKAQLVIPRDLA
jgi:FKBP-type peptidyl-prolyl cis-trans isomerase